MKNRGIEGRTRRAAVLAPFLLCSVLAGCSTGGEGMLLLVDPAKYQYHTCEQLATAAKAQSARQQDLAALIERAERGTAGALVGTIAYKSDYTAAGQELRLVEATARSKNCVTASTWRSNAVIQ
jgi:hypothetical protein